MCAWSVTHADLSAPLQQRRGLLRGGVFAALAASGLFEAGSACAADEALAFAATSMQDALVALGGIPAIGAQVVLTVPDAVENGAIVPVSVASSLPGTSEVFIVVESNPNPLVVRFIVPEGTEPSIATRVKMAESGNVFAVVKSHGKLYAACKRTEVTVGGCG